MITKQQLIEKVAVLERDKERLTENDEKLRLELSKALGAGTKKKGEYSSEYVYIVYSWFEIFGEIGKLLEKKRYVNLEEGITSMKIVANDNHKHIIDMLQHHFPDKFQDFKCNPEYLR